MRRALPNARTWIRLTEHYPDTPLMHAVARTFTSDDLPTEAVEYAHPHGRIEYTETDTERLYYGASLDHAVWFHHLRPATDWTLHDLPVQWGARGRPCVRANSGADGIHVATVTQRSCCVSPAKLQAMTSPSPSSRTGRAARPRGSSVPDLR